MNNTSAIYTPEQIAAIKELANGNIVQILTALELYDDMKDKYPKYINGRCPIHQGDNKTAFSWDYDKGIFKCWTRSCHEAGNDVYGLIEQLLKVSFVEAVEWVIETIKVDLEKLQISQGVVENISFIRNTKKNLIKSDVAIKDIVLSKLKDATEYIVNERGFKNNIVSVFQPKYGADDIVENMSNRIAFPVRNIDSFIVGFTGRRIDDLLKIPKWIHSDGFEKMNHLYNMYRAKEHIQKTGIIIIVEGPYDVMAFENAGIKNVVAVLGVALSNQQRSLVWSSGAFTAILAFDRGEAGEEASVKITKELEKYLSVEQFQITEDKDDVGEMMPEELLKEYNKIRN